MWRRRRLSDRHVVGARGGRVGRGLERGGAVDLHLLLLGQDCQGEGSRELQPHFNTESVPRRRSVVKAD